jgi:hypothetical protein
MAHLQSIVNALRDREPLPPLYPRSPWRPEISRQVIDSNDEALFGRPTSGSSLAEAVRAGLLVWNDDLPAAHAIAQGIETATGSFWHAIIHRREGDDSNSAYWWQQTGEHSAFLRIYEHVLAETQDELGVETVDFRHMLETHGVWLPIDFVKACKAAHESSGDDIGFRRIQVIEIETLLNWCVMRVTSE